MRDFTPMGTKVCENDNCMIYFIGDVHGEFIELARRISTKKIENSAFIQVGDFGMGLGKDDDLKELNKVLMAGNNLLYAIRGNHDDPFRFRKKEVIGNITLLSDYSVLRLEGKVILLVGGAISIDRSDRVEGNSYWMKEKFIFDTEKLTRLANKVKKIDIIVTHSAPEEFWPFELTNLVRRYCRLDSNLEIDLQDERRQHSLLLKYLLNKFPPRYWYYGHFHTIAEGHVSGVRYNALAEMQFKIHED